MAASEIMDISCINKAARLLDVSGINGGHILGCRCINSLEFLCLDSCF